MFRIRNLQWWTGVLLFTLMVLIVVFAYLARKPLCIDSKLVERIDRISEKGTSTAFRCNRRKHVPFDQELAVQVQDLGKRLQTLERYFEWLGPMRSRINLTIIAGSGGYFRLQDHEIFLSESIFKSQGQLEKAILRVWFRERAPLQLQAQLLVEETMTDFLYFTLIGDLDLQDPRSGLKVSQDLEAKWPRVLANLKGYCKSVWSSMDHSRICDDIENYAVEEIPVQSLRPLLTQTLIESYQGLEPKERFGFLKGLADSLPSLDFHEQNFGMTIREHPQQSFQVAISQVENWNYFLSEMKSRVPYAQKLSALNEINLKRRGFDGTSPQSELDVLIFTGHLSNVQKQKIRKQVESHPERLIGFESEKHIQLSFLAEPLDKRILGSIHANTGILIHCGPLELNKLDELSKKVQRLLYVRTCGDQDVKLSGFLEKGIIAFAQQNPDLKFAQLHLPSLMMAVRKLPGLNPFQLIHENKKETLKILGWKDPEYDQNLKAYRAQSAIEFVDWYRL